jgi:hypothetical protein
VPTLVVFCERAFVTQQNKASVIAVLLKTVFNLLNDKSIDIGRRYERQTNDLKIHKAAIKTEWKRINR